MPESADLPVSLAIGKTRKIERRSLSGQDRDRQIRRILLADSNRKFLIDTGADLSVLPKSFAPQAQPSKI